MTTLKTISMYLRAAKTEAEEAGESTEGMASSVSELRQKILELTGQKVDIMIDEDTFKNTFKIMEELSDVWSTLTDTTRANILEMVGGKRNANIVAALLENFTVAEEALEKSLNSAGSAAKENEKHLESIEGRISLLKAAFESLSSTIVDDDAIKIIVSGLTGIISGVDNLIQLLGGLKVLIPVISGLLVTNNLSSIVNLFMSLSSSNLLFGFTKNISVLKAWFTTITTGSSAAASALTMLGGTGAVVSASISALAIVIGGLAAAFINAKQKQKEARQAMIEGAKEASAYSDELSQLYSEYMTLATAMGDTEEVTQELTSAQDAIIDKLGLHGKKVEELIEKYGDYKTAITATTKEELERQRLIMLGATSSYEQAIVDSFDSANNPIRVGYIGELKNLVDYIENSDLYSSLLTYESSLGTYRVNSDWFGYDIDTAEGIIETQERIFELLSDLEFHGFENTDFFNDLTSFVSGISVAIDDYQTHLKELDNTIIQLEFLNASSIFGTPSDQESFDRFRDYFINSIQMTHDFEVSYENVSHAVDEFLSKQGAFAEFFKEINNDTSNTSLAILSKFQEKFSLISVAVDEFNSYGSVTADTYNKIISLGEDYADLFSFTNGKIELQSDALKTLVDDLINEYGAMLAVNGAGEDDIAMLVAYTSALSSSSKEIEDVVSAMDSLANVLVDAINGTEMSTLQVMDLINQYPELAKSIISTANGYKIEESAVRDLISAKAQLIKMDELSTKTLARNKLLSGKTNASTAIAKIDEIFEKNGSKIKSFEDYIVYWQKEFPKSNVSLDWIDGYVEYVEACILQVQRDSEIQELINDILNPDSDKIIAGENDNIKSAFEKEYERHQHLLAMDRESVSSYLMWFKKAYEEAYRTKQISEEEYYRYQEEYYDKYKNLRSDKFDLTIDNMEFGIEVLKHNNAVDNEIIASWRAILQKINDEIDYYEVNGEKNYGKEATKEYLMNLQSRAMDVEKEIAALEKSALDKEYNNHQHMLVMGQESLSTYLIWLKNAFEKAYENEIIGLDEYYQYQEEYREKIKTLRSDAFDENIEDMKFDIEVLKHNGADDSEIIASWRGILQKINEEISYYESVGERVYGKEHTEDYIAKLQKDAWDYEEQISSLEAGLFNKEYSEHQHRLAMDLEDTATYLAWLKGAYEEAYKAGKMSLEDYYQYQEEYYEKMQTLRSEDFNTALEDKKFDIEVLKHNGAADDEIITSWRNILSEINKEIAYYTEHSGEYSAEVLENILKNLQEEIWSTEEEIISSIDAVVKKVDESLSGFQSFYSTMTDAAKEYASTGALSADSLRNILSLEPKYLSYLQDENGHLVLNEYAIRDVIAAKTEDLAATNALTLAKKILIATEDKDIETLTELTEISSTAAQDTWDLAFETLARARTIAKASGLDESYFDHAESYMQSMKSLAQTASSTVSAFYDTQKHGYVAAADGLDQIISLTKELIKWETEQRVEALEKEKEAYKDIVDKKKEALALSREQEKHDSSTADKLKEISKLQSRIDQLALDDSREAQAQKAQLESELAEKQKELADEQSEYAYDKQTEALDDQLDAFEDNKDKEIHALQDALNSEEKLYRAAIDRINNNWDSLYEDLIRWNFNYGSSLQQDLVSAWDAASKAVERYGSFVSALEGVNNDTIVGSSTSGGYASFIVDMMKRNSSQWLSASASERKSLEDKNVELASVLESYLGKKITKNGDGVWLIDGKNLYDMYATNTSVGHEDYAKSIVNMMKNNSSKWLTSTEAEQKKLADKNIELAAALSSYLGKKITRDGNGVWLIDGKKLYDVYHTGGIVGGGGTSAQKETMALLENGEMVLDDKKQRFMMSAVGFLEELSNKIGSTIDIAKLSDLSVFTGKKSNITRMLDKLDGNSSGELNFMPNVNVYITHGGDMDEADAKRYGEAAANAVLEKLGDAFSKRGIVRTGHNLIKT